MFLVQPIWLLAALGIIIPIAIHLWNVKQGKTLKIGSIQLLARTEQARAKSLRLTELLLLLLRCLLILLLALLLAKPFWQRTNTQKGWVLMERKDAQQAYMQYKILVDSLTEAGYSFHLFEPGFEEKDLSIVLKDANAAGDTKTESYWQLVKELDQQTSPGMPVYLFTGNRLNRFIGKRPEIAMALNWKIVASDTTLHFIANAYLTASDSIVVTIGESNPLTTLYHQEVIATNQPRQNQFRLDVNNGNLAVRYLDNDPVTVDTTTRYITVFTDKYFDDTRYIAAVIQSVKQVTMRRITLKLVNRIDQVPAKQDWLFWLSAQLVPARVNADHTLRYEDGNPVNVHSWVLANESAAGSETALYKRVPYSTKNVDVLWRDGFGEPLLTREEDGTKQLYRFYSHFDPSWNDLAWSASFPKLIYTLIEGDLTKKIVEENDQRTIAETQLQLPSSTRKNRAAVIPNNVAIDLKQMLWALIFILFCIERFFSFATKKEQSHA